MPDDSKFDGSTISDDALERITKSVPRAHILGQKEKPAAAGSVIKGPDGALYYLSVETGLKYKISNLVHQYEALLNVLEEQNAELEAYRAKEIEDEAESGIEEQDGEESSEEEGNGKDAREAVCNDGESKVEDEA